MIPRIALIAAAAVLAACSPKADAPGEAAAPAGEEAGARLNPLLGKWQLVRAQVAPWWDGKGEEPIADPAFTRVSFEPTRSAGAPIFTCQEPHYGLLLTTPPGLFQGNLKDAWTQARALGFYKTNIEVLSYSCRSGERDISLDFAMQGDDTILFGLENVIYSLQRSPR